MGKALWTTAREEARDGSVRPATHSGRLDWRRRMSDNIAYALLGYTALQIVVTMAALKTISDTILPFFALILLVAAIVPGCQMFERRWERLSDDEAADPALKGQFNRDRLLLWIAALGLPFVVSGVIRGVEYFI